MNHQTLKIRSLEFTTNLIQGPLAGYTCAPMRVQTWRYSTPAYCSTEMVAANTLVYAKKIAKRYTHRDQSEGPLCFQLSGSDPEVMAQATKIVDAMDTDIIEINCGCPVQKIRNKGSGSKLLSQPDNLKRLISSVRNNTDKAVSIKIRVSGDGDDQNDVALAKLIEQEGADVLVVHGRHWTERYDVGCRYDQIQNIVNAVNIPVIGNGDVCDKPTLAKMLETGCAGVMVARHSMGQPWIFDQLESNDFIAPSAQKIGEIFIEHISDLAELDSEYRAVMQARNMGKYYTRSVVNHSADFLNSLMRVEDLQSFSLLVKKYF
jgi:tRNA-dihydrouridine synthase B